MDLRSTLVDRAGDIAENRDPAVPFDPSAVTRFSGRPIDAAPSSSHGRRIRAATAAAAVIVLIAGIAVAVHRNGADERVVGVAAGPPDTSAPEATTGPVGLESLNGLFVATADEFNGPTFINSWPVFSTRAWQAGLGYCLADDDETFTPVGDASAWTSGGVRNNTQFPDLVKLRAGTFVDDPDAPATGDVGSTATAPAGEASADDCDVTLVDRVLSVARDADTWTQRWDVAITGLDTDPDVVAARDGYVACMADRGITVVPGGSKGVVDGDVFDLADTAERDGDTDRVAELARAYGACIAPVSDAMDAFRLSARGDFYRDNAAELEGLARDIDDLEVALRAAYEIPVR